MTGRHDGSSASTERFDAELRRAARSLVTQELPAGILDERLAPGLSGTHGGAGFRTGPLPGFATFAALITVIVAVSVAVFTFGVIGPAAESPAASGGPSASVRASPVAPAGLPFRTTVEIVRDLSALGYSCNDGGPLSSVGPGPEAYARDSAVCAVPGDVEEIEGVAIVGESRRGNVVHVGAKADVVGPEDDAGRDALLALIDTTVEAALESAAAAGELRAWAAGELPGLGPGEGSESELRGVAVRLERAESGTFVFGMDAILR